MTSLPRGELLADRFQLGEFLGSGGLAEVYAALDKETGREVAIKIMHVHLAEDEQLCERFRRELLATRSLDHPNIVRLFDLHRHGKRPFLSMERLRGETLNARIERGPLPFAEARRLTIEIARALQSAHRAGLVHRDVKPHNVIVTPDGRAKLLDFGLARAAGWVRLTAQSTVMGTPGYLAPELIEGRGCDARADLYALGATYFELLTGTRAFPSLDAFETLQRKKQPAPSARAINPEISEDDDRSIQRALDPDPERRFLDAEQLIQALSGTAPPAALVAPPALMTGELDVIAYLDSHHSREGIARVIDRLDAKVTKRWWRRLRLSGNAILVSRTSRRSAEQVVAICEQEGVATALEPSAPRKEIRERAAKHALPIGVLSGATSGSLVGWVSVSGFSGVAGVIGATGVAAGVALTGGLGVVVGGVIAGIAWTFAGMGEAPAISDLPTGDAPLVRLLSGLGRRVQRMEELAAAAPANRRPLADELVASARRLLASAREIAREAEKIPDALASSNPDAVTLPPGTLAVRDAAVTRLLEIAAGFDEVLAILRAAELDAEPARAALARLRAESEWAARALAEVAIPL